VIPAPRDPANAVGPAGAPPGAGREATADPREAATAWALAARDGNPAAQAALVRATQAEVWRFAAALVDPDSADDLTQETYLRAFRALPGFQGRSSARTWLLGIARRVCADHLRTVVRRRRLAERLAAHAHTDHPHPDPAGQLGTADLVRRLPAERRGAFVLTQLLGLSYAEAAAVEGVPVGTIRSRVARARDDLIDAVGDALAG
jgi:RNA polymerase sigma-70 factor (ECF subfamily)